MMAEPAPQQAAAPLLSSLEIQARTNRDAHLQAKLNDPESLKIPGIESLATMQQTIAELQERYEVEAQRLASMQSTLESLNGQLETERKKLSYGEYLFAGSKKMVEGLSDAINQCLSHSDQGKMQTVLLVRAGNIQFVESWPSVKKMVQAEVKRLENEISKLTGKGGKNG